MYNPRDIKWLFSLLLFSGLLFSCSQAEIDDIDTPRAGQQPVTLPLLLHIEAEQIATRANTSGEIAIAENDLYLLCFDNANKLAEMPMQVKQVGAGYTATLHPSTSSRTLVVLANTQGAILSGAINWRLKITTLDEVRNGLLSPSRLATGATFITSNLTLHPLYASVVLPSIGAGTIISTTGDATGQPLSLRRATAKITVLKDGAVGHDTSLDQLQLQGANLGNTPIDSYLLEAATTPRATLSKTSGGNSVETMLVAADGNQCDPLYAYETSADKAPFVVIKTLNQGRTQFFRLDFHKVMPTGLTQAFPLLRNTHYQIVIKKVDAIMGYSTAAEAIANKGANRIDYAFVLGESDYQDAVTNGVFCLSVNRSEYITFCDNYLTAINVINYAHGAPTATPIGSISATSGITLTNGTTIPINNGAYFRYQIIINLLPTFTTGTLSLRISNLSKDVAIRRYSALKSQAQTVALGDGYIQAIAPDSLTKPWLWLSTDGGATKRYSINNIGNSLHFGVDKASLSRTASLCLFKKRGEGTSCIFVEQLP
ncbi:MAG: hypothetical protein RRY33_03295 [Alistipes sp.]